MADRFLGAHEAESGLFDHADVQLGELLSPFGGQSVGGRAQGDDDRSRRLAGFVAWPAEQLGQAFQRDLEGLGRQVGRIGGPQRQPPATTAARRRGFLGRAEPVGQRPHDVLKRVFGSDLERLGALAIHRADEVVGAQLARRQLLINPRVRRPANGIAVLAHPTCDEALAESPRQDPQQVTPRPGYFANPYRLVAKPAQLPARAGKTGARQVDGAPERRAEVVEQQPCGAAEGRIGAPFVRFRGQSHQRRAREGRLGIRDGALLVLVAGVERGAGRTVVRQFGEGSVGVAELHAARPVSFQGGCEQQADYVRLSVAQFLEERAGRVGEIQEYAAAGAARQAGHDVDPRAVAPYAQPGVAGGLLQRRSV